MILRKTTITVILAIILSLNAAKGWCQIACSNPLEYLAIAEGNITINMEIENEINGQMKTALIQNTIAAEFTKIHEWERKYSRYLQAAEGYASSLKAATTLYEDGVRMFINLGRLRNAINTNPQGIVATMSMNNLYIETATELVSVYTLLRNAVATGGRENMLTGAARSEILWALSDRLAEFNRKIVKLTLSIKYYTMLDFWHGVTAGMVDRSVSEISSEAHRRWRRAAIIGSE